MRDFFSQANSLNNWLFICLAPGEKATPWLGEQLNQQRLDWDQVLRQAGTGYALTNLKIALERRSLVSAVPQAIWQSLLELYRLNQARNHLLFTHLLGIGQHCNQIGVKPLLLKGAQRLVTGTDLGERVLGDLDLLIPADRIDDCFQMLLDLGWQEAPAKASAPFGWKFCHHLAPLLHPTEPITIELHHQVLDLAIQKLLPVSDAWATARERNLDQGISFLELAPDEQIRHTIIHGCWDACCESNLLLPPLPLQLRSLLDLVELRHSSEQGIDWCAIHDQFAAQRQQTTLNAYLIAIYALFGQPLPKVLRPSKLARWKGDRLAEAVRQPTGNHWIYQWCQMQKRLRRLPARLTRMIGYNGSSRQYYNSNSTGKVKSKSL